MTKTKSTRRALLSSALALVLCVSMLVGSTYAWFTDSVTSAGNIIKSGTLDVTMEWADGTTDPTDTVWTDASQGAIFNYDLWEPGYVSVRHVKIANVGTLALKYQINIVANGEVSELADVIDVYYVDPATQVSDRSVLIDDYKVGTLSDVLAGTAGTTHGDLLAGASASVTIALKMQESAGNEYQGLSIGTDFSVQVLATQLTSEEDSFDELYDKDAVTYVAYDSAKTVAENATALQAAINAAEEGDIILIGAGNWYATKYKQFTINTDNITLVGENGTVLGFAEENRNSILDVHGDNVTIRNIEFNKNKNEYNQCILATGAENLTVDSCTFYGENYQGGNTPTMGIYILEYLDGSSNEANDEVTKYTITNNTFLGAAVGSYKGGPDKVPNDPGATAAQVSEDMVIKNNTFIGANILIENWRSWSKEANRDHKFVPTIENNNFVSPNLCFANTPHSIYLRCYRQGDPDKILPAGYIDAFAANNTIATPSNDTVVTYNGTDYVLSNAYGTFYRDNATYGVIAYCYGQDYAVLSNDADDLNTLIATAEEGSTIQLAPGTYEGVVLEGTIAKNLTIVGMDGAVVKGIHGVKGTSQLKVVGLTLKNINFEDKGLYFDNDGTPWNYVENLTMTGCTFVGTGTADDNVGNRLFDVGGDSPQSNQYFNVVIENCTVNNALQGIRLGGVAGDGNKVVGNTITNVGHNAVTVRSTAASGAVLLVEGNTISNGGDRAFRIGTNSGTITYKDNVITNCGDPEDGSNFKANAQNGTVYFEGNTVNGVAWNPLA